MQGKWTRQVRVFHHDGVEWVEHLPYPGMPRSLWCGYLGISHRYYLSLYDDELTITEERDLAYPSYAA